MFSGGKESSAGPRKEKRMPLLKTAAVFFAFGLVMLIAAMSGFAGRLEPAAWILWLVFTMFGVLCAVVFSTRKKA